MTPPTSLTLALWATNQGVAIDGLDRWVARIERKMAETRAAGATLLVMPEYAADHWLSFAPGGLTLAQEIPWMAEQAPRALELLRPLPERHGVALLAGTMPWGHGNGYRNRAWLLLPDGRAIAQDKLSLTPWEMNPEGWNMQPGDALSVVEWNGLRVVVLICLDIEMPALSMLLARQAPDLVLVPSMTHGLAGYSRVFGCAKARAIELMAVVAATGVVGSTMPSLKNVSGCSVYLPCEPTLGGTGLFADIPAVEEHPGDGPFLLAEEVPVGTVRALRGAGSEVWPGAWSADHVRVVASAG